MKLQTTKKSKTISAIHLAIVLVFCLTTFCSIAQGNLLIMPKRVVFDGNKKSEEINLANIGKDTATYVISFVQMRMNEAGQFEQIINPDSAQLFADKNIRFYPRSVTLAPNEAQSVKLQVFKTNELAPGEYRSHLYLRAIPTESALGEKLIKQDSAISVKLVPVFGISLPIIIRVGENNAKVSLEEVAFKKEKDTIPVVNITFKRDGNMSVYGDLVVEHIADDGATVRVGLIKGLAVYTPNKTRRSLLRLNNTSGVDYHSGKLRIIYSDQSTKPKVLAENTVELN